MIWGNTTSLKSSLARTLVGLSALFSGGQVLAQATASPYTYGTRYDATGKVTGTIAPDPDGSGPLHYAAVRNTYDAAGRLVLVEKGELSTWQSDSIAPSSWSGFSVLQTLQTAYDLLNRKTRETTSGFESGSLVVKSVTDYSYDPAGRPECTAIRMNPAAYGSLPASACSPSTLGPDGPDRISRNIYDDAGQLLQVRKGVGSSIEVAQETYSYTPNGKKEYVIDANGNRAKFVYDGFDRLSQWQFPSNTRTSSYDDSTQTWALATAGSVNAADYEEYGYDNNGNRTSLRKRDGRTLTFAFDPLNRAISKIVPDHCVAGYACTEPSAAAVRDVYYDYDLQGHQLHAKFDALSGADGIANTYNGFGELSSSAISMAGFSKSICSTPQPCLYDRDGNRTQLTVEGQSFTYDFDGVDRLSGIYEGATDAGTPQLDQFNYNNAALLASRAEPSGPGGPSINYGYDSIGRLLTQSDAFPATSTSNAVRTLSYNSASQLTSETRDNDAYAWLGAVPVTRNYSTSGLNQYTAAGSSTFTYDSNGSLTGDGTNSYVYDAENRLIKATNGSTITNLQYDAAGRLWQVDQGSPSSISTRFVYDGDALLAEYAAAGNLTALYVHGSNTAADDPLVWYTGGGISSKRFLHADHLGSIIAATSTSGAPSINSYDEYGIPGSNNAGRFQYTGQAWLPELRMYYYKARVYSPTLGRFLQIDPIGYQDRVHLYAYANNDPINNEDFEGKAVTLATSTCTQVPELCGGQRPQQQLSSSATETRAQLRSESRAGTARSLENYSKTANTADKVASAVTLSGTKTTIGRSNLGVYSNGWSGNKYVSTVKVTTIAENAGRAATGLEIGVETAQYTSGEISTGRYGLDLGIAGVGLLGQMGAGLAILGSVMTSVGVQGDPIGPCDKCSEE